MTTLFLAAPATSQAPKAKPLLIDSHMHVWSGDPEQGQHANINAAALEFQEALEPACRAGAEWECACG
jgi:hypothetical protein